MSDEIEIITQAWYQSLFEWEFSAWSEKIYYSSSLPTVVIHILSRFLEISPPDVKIPQIREWFTFFFVFFLRVLYFPPFVSTLVFGTSGVHRGPSGRVRE